MDDEYQPRDVDLVDQTVQNLRKLEDEDTLLGQTTLFGHRVHVMFIRVEGGDDGDTNQAPTNDPHGRWMALVEAEPEGYFNTIEVPGFEGEYVFFTNSNVR